jgi:uncharacterized protein RhaS with RHS repeats
VTINPGYQAPEARQPTPRVACAARVRLGKTRFAYDAAQGVRISRDPIGENGGINLYGYVGNDPVNLRDPLGLCEEDEDQLDEDFKLYFEQLMRDLGVEPPPEEHPFEIPFSDEAIQYTLQGAAEGENVLSFGRKLDFLFNNNINPANEYNAARAAANASRIGIADTAENRAAVESLFNKAYNNPASIVGPGNLPGSNLREFFLPGVTGTGSKIQFVEQGGKVITIIAQ